MVQTSSTAGLVNRVQNFFFWLWGLIYLFFATIFTDHKKLGANPRSGQFGNGGGPKMHGMKKTMNMRGG